MKRLVAGLIVCSSVFLWSAPASASLKSDCRKGDQAACEQYAFNRCVQRLKAEGYTTAEAQALCS